MRAFALKAGRRSVFGIRVSASRARVAWVPFLPLVVAAFGPVTGPSAVAAPARECASGTLQTHFETLDWAMALNNSDWEPYLGSLGEAFDLGPGYVYCGAFWFTSGQEVHPERNYVYVWEEGINREPGRVLTVIPNVDFSNVGLWPDFGRNDIPVNLEVSGPFTIGFWSSCGPDIDVCLLIGTDWDSNTGHPWEYCVCEWYDYPAWHIVPWDFARSLGIGVYFGPPPPVPVRESTWGRIKSLYPPGRTSR